MKRQDWEPTEYSRLCSDHFISGARSNHPLSPDFVPSVFQHTSSPVKRKGQQSLESFQRRQAIKSRKRDEESRRSAAQALLDLTSGLNIPVEDLELENTTEADVERTFETSNSVCTQTDLSMDHISAMELELQNLRDETRDIKADKSRQFLQKSSFENNDEKVRVFTGLPSFTVLMIFYDAVKVCLKDSPTMMCFQQFLLACMRLSPINVIMAWT
ncbi:uncharacterized protein LOC132884664 [Neoarius graeffei]|uniref:uncharacterized protein LOC132884664 n=1 Tax=Neoarius graeffei TaxID=443677 RepID=UPI00298BF0A6|nr:uncharacterized protein LOC132884664 [Neoarius graeffei]